MGVLAENGSGPAVTPPFPSCIMEVTFCREVLRVSLCNLWFAPEPRLDRDAEQHPYMLASVRVTPVSIPSGLLNT